MSDRRIKSASGSDTGGFFTARRLALAEEANFPADDDKKHRRSWRHSTLLYPSTRVRAVYGAMLLLLFYTVAVPALSKQRDTALALGATSPGAGQPLPPGGRRRAKWSERDVAPTDPKHPHTVVDGMLVVNPDATLHPIHQLINTARTDWAAKVARQSKSLEEAVIEYKRRNKRPPPPGFDRWWDYVVKHNVQLPDEYDQINKDLQLFWGISPADLRRRIEKASKARDTYTLKVRGGKIEASGVYKKEKLHDRRKEGQMALMEPIVDLLPDMSIVYSVHDTPNTVISWEHHQDILMHIDEGDYLPDNEVVEGTFHGWASACPYSSNLKKRGQTFLGIPESRVDNKSFIVSHTASMDICAHPEIIAMHGLTAGKDHYVKSLDAMFCISKTTLHADVLGVPPERVVTAADVPLIPWEEKTSDRLLWRGGNTAIHYATNIPWQMTQRVRMIELTNAHTGTSTVLSPPGKMGAGTVGAAASTEPNASLNNRLMDVGFVGKPIQCDKTDGTCEDIAERYTFKNKVTLNDFDHSKYLFDMDGNGWSARFQRLMMSGSLVFKSTVLPEWWNDRAQSWVHYVPVKLDYTDLYDSMAFFHGDEEGQGGEDELAKQIAHAGRDWSERYYRQEDMTAYVFRLYLEWARLQSSGRNQLKFDISD